MKKNQKGEVATAVVILIAVGSLFVGTIFPKFNPIKSLFKTDPTKHKASFAIQRETSKPVLLESSDGRHVAVGNEVELYYDTGEESTVPKKTLGERIGDFFANLTTLGLVFVFGSLAFFGGAPIVWIWRKYLTMKRALKNTVVGIKELKEKDKEAFERLKPSLASAHDRKDKIVIDKMKTDLN